jgi:hypothetical protein
MRPVAAVERLLERAFERSTARLFRLRLRPVQVLRRVERAMEEGRRRDGSAMLVPNRFTVTLHPGDVTDDQAGLAMLAAELADGALEFARGRGYSLLARTHVLLATSARVAPGEVEVSGAFEADPRGRADAGPGAEAMTRAFARREVRAPRLLLHGSRSGRPGPTVEVDGSLLTIGRDRTCDVVLGDSAVSRRHARLQARAGAVLIADLDSTNGTWVNGRQVTETALGDGDVIEIGGTRFEVEVVE